MKDFYAEGIVLRILNCLIF